ncbi:MAG: class I SAM-dependent methyltransferase [Alphaproteobacteria bacterium]|nr:class I SAM-dependent methyltransferase [Alphaproteobacteria bacterium]MBV8413400.1 class I SAM-dependent methyltransferase [Alphaproteobacteria bacterium]
MQPAVVPRHRIQERGGSGFALFVDTYARFALMNRPLAPLYRPGERFEISAAGFSAWRESECFRRVFAAYRDYPPQSLQSDEARALLHHLIAMRLPDDVLEVGTYMAGTTEVLARALWETGKGHLETIDPFGAERCPKVIATLPEELQEFITFQAVTSAAHFDRAIGRGREYDFVLIDGSHEFEFVMFDLMCAARLMRPRGLVVLDNIEQPGPRFATRLFLKNNPDWREVAGVIDEAHQPPPFERGDPSFPLTQFYIVQAPPYYAVNDVPRSFGAINSNWDEVQGVALELTEPVEGTLHVQVFLRTFGLVGPEEFEARKSFDLKMHAEAEDRRLRLAFDRPLRGSPQAPGLRRRIEIALAYTGRTPARLKSPPLPYPASHE